MNPHGTLEAWLKQKQDLITLLRRRLHELKKQKGVLGVQADPSITLEIQDLERQIETLQAELMEAQTIAQKESQPAAGHPNLVRAIVAGLEQEKELNQVMSVQDQPAKYRGLILLVGTGPPRSENPMDQSALDAINYHVALNRQEVGLERCWLIASAGERGSERVAQTLQTVCQKFGVAATIHLVHDPFYNIQETYDLVQQIYDDQVAEAGLTEQEVIADFTGSTKPMSAGVILACGHRRSIQYFPRSRDGGEPTPIILRFTPRPGQTG